MIEIKHKLIHPDLLIDAGYHNGLIYRLILPTYIIAIEIHIEIVHVFHLQERLKHIDIVHIKSLLRQHEAAFPQQFRPEYN